MSRFSVAILVLAGLSLAAGALPAGQTLQGALRPEFAAAPRLGDLDASKILNLELGLPLPDPAGLDAFIATLYDPHSSNYRRWLRPAEFDARFGPSPADYRRLMDFVRSQGLTIRATHANRLLLQVRGSAGDVERVFHVSLGRRLRADGSEFFAPDQAPSVDLDLPGLSLSGLDNFARRHNHARPRPRPSTAQRGPGQRPQIGTGGDAFWGWSYQGQDFRDAYVPGLALQGSGQNIGLVEFGGFYAADISTYATTSTPPLPTDTVITTVQIGGCCSDPMSNGDTPAGAEGDCSEVSLDIEMAMSMAPQAGIVVYEANFSSGTMSDVLTAISDADDCSQVSSSWGGESMDSSVPALLSKMAADGQAFFNASGDGGAYASGDEAGPVGEPDNLSPYITEVGGTNLNTTAPGNSPPYIAYTSENTWNDYSGTCSGVVGGCSNCFGGASGGGICDGGSGSNVLALPTYQNNVSMANNGGSTTDRNIPDVSAVAENFWVIYCDLCPAESSTGETAGQQLAPFDGTSGASPLWAGFMALVNEQSALEGGPALGNANTALYSLGKGASYTDYFHDIADNSNNDPVNTNNQSCDTVYYSAVTGYDLATGWGSPKGALIQAMVGSVVSPTITPTFSASPSFTASPTITPTPSISPTFSASPTFTASPTATPTPNYLDSGQPGLALLAPNPARYGEPVTLYFGSQPSRTRWKVYGITGRLVASLDLSGTGPHRLSTQDFATGVYVARVIVNYAKGDSQVLFLKFAVIR